MTTERNITPITPAYPRLIETGMSPGTVEVHDWGRHPDTLVDTHAGYVVVKFIARNGRIYSVRLEGNRLRVSAQEGGIYVHPKADNVVEVTNLTPFERGTEEAMQ